MIDNLPTEIYSDIKNAIIAIAEGLKVPAEMLLTAIVKQGLVESISNICLYAFLLILAFVVTKMCLPMWTKYFNSSYTSEGTDAANVITMVITGLLWFGFVLFTLNTVTETVTGFINPEYRAIQLVLKMIK